MLIPLKQNNFHYFKKKNMCFTKILKKINKKGNYVIPRPSIAETDIIVFKVIRKNNKGLYFNLFINNKLERWEKVSITMRLPLLKESS